MISVKCLVFAVVGVTLSAHALSAQDLSMYRDFRVGMNLASVAAQTGTNPSRAKLIHQRPVVIQELAWRPLSSRSGSSPQTDPVEEIVFSFYNDELFRLVVTYHREKTAGLTETDLIDSISETYGPATRPIGTITSSPLSQSYHDDTDDIIARWEDAQYSFNLFKYPYRPTFGIVILSKRLDALALTAITEAVRLDKQEAPQRDAERQRQQDADTRVAQEKARVVNKPAFRP